MILPTRSEFENIILPRVEEYALEFLSTPELWGDSYILDGKYLFFDEESSKEDVRRSSEHLIDTWEVKLQLVGDELEIEISASKEVDGWNLEELLFEGTSDYQVKGDYAMKFWYRYAEMWMTRKKRSGVRDFIVRAFKRLQRDAIHWGVRKAVKEWKKMKGYR